MSEEDPYTPNRRTISYQHESMNIEKNMCSKLYDLRLIFSKHNFEVFHGIRVRFALAFESFFDNSRFPFLNLKNAAFDSVRNLCIIPIGGILTVD